VEDTNINNRLIIGLYDDEDNLLFFNSLNDSFPEDLEYITVGIKWKANYHPWHEASYRLYSFFSSQLGRELDYPKTFKELFLVLESVMYEYVIDGTVGLDEDTGYFSSKAYDGETKMLEIVREILDSDETEVEKLPIYCTPPTK
jgi:hypothetical protein